MPFLDFLSASHVGGVPKLNVNDSLYLKFTTKHQLRDQE